MFLALALLRHSVSDGTAPQNHVNASWQSCVTSPGPSSSPRGHPGLCPNWNGVEVQNKPAREPWGPQLQLLPPDHDWRGVCPVTGWKRHLGEKSKSIRARVHFETASS